MAVFAGPEIVNDGLILGIDILSTKNNSGTYQLQDLTSKSNGITIAERTAISGGPTTNVAYDLSGNAIFTIGNLTAAVSVEETETNYKYHVTATSGGETGQLRITVPDGILVDDEYYCISTKFKIINGYFELKDWNDQATSFVYSVDLGNGEYYQAIYAKRTDYNSTYRFVDCFISEGTVVDIYEFQIELGTDPHVFVAGQRTTPVADIPLYSKFIVSGVDGTQIDPKVSRFYDGVTTGSLFVNKTIMQGFTTGSNITSRQVITAQGLITRGISFYIYNSKLYAGSYNTFSNANNPGDIWAGAWFEVDIQPNTTYIVTHVIRDAPADGTLAADVQELYINDELYGKLTGRALGLHGNETLAYHWESQSNYELLYADGDVDSVRQYHIFDGTALFQLQYERALSLSEIKQNFEATRRRYGI